MWQRDWRLRFTPWLVPAAYTVAAILLGFALPRLELRLFPQILSSISVAAATTIYASIATGMITLTGIVFSLTFVMIQFSATAYSPRLALWMSRDPFLGHALGIFIATFVYAIAALAWVDRGGSARVPLTSSLVIVVLLLASMGMFIALIERVGMLQIGRMLTFTGNQGRRVIMAIYPPLETLPTSPIPERSCTLSPSQGLVHKGPPRAVQSFKIATLVQLAAQSGGVIDVTVSTGDVIVEETLILRVLGSFRKIPEKLLRDAIELGEQRTFHQDPKYAIRLMVDIAIKALSPAINDPTTAVQALDQIGDLLLRLGLRRIEIGTFCDATGTVRVIIPFPSWDDFLALAFDEITFYGASSLQVMRRMRALISDLIALLPDERNPALRQWQGRLQETVDRSFHDADHKREASVEDRQGLGGSRRNAAGDFRIHSVDL